MSTFRRLHWRFAILSAYGLINGAVWYEAGGAQHLGQEKWA